MPLPTNTARKQAKEAGEKFFMPTKPCKHGHLALKFVSNGECTECIKIRTSNPDFKKLFAKKCLDYYHANKEIRKATMLKSNRKNSAKLNEKSKAWRAKNKETFKKCCKESRQKRHTFILANNAFRRSARLQSTPKWLNAIDFAQLQEMYDIAKAKTIQTGIKHDVDHIIPLINNEVCGMHVPWNLQVLTASENRRKSNHLEF